jgi:hypothetical protein
MQPTLDLEVAECVLRARGRVCPLTRTEGAAVGETETEAAAAIIDDETGPRAGGNKRAKQRG